MRYYNFALPLLAISACNVCESGSKWRIAVAAPMCVLIVYAAGAGISPYVLGLVDNPELYGIAIKPARLAVVSGLSLLALIAWTQSQQLGFKFFLYAFWPVTIAISAYQVNAALRTHLMTATVYDKAGIFSRQILSPTDLSKTVVVGTEVGHLYRTLFFIDHAEASIDVIPLGATYELNSLPTEKNGLF